MTTKDFNSILNRRGNGSMKWSKEHIGRRFNVRISDDDEIYPMYIADTDFKYPKKIMDEFYEKYQEPDFGYFDMPDGYFESIVEWYKKIHGISIQKEWIIPSIGTVTSLNLLADMLGRGKNFLIFTPVYRPFKNCEQFGNLYTLPLIYKDQQYFIDFENLEKSFIENHIDLILFCNPHNPGGRVWNRKELRRLVTLCKKYQVIILSDEIHADVQLSERKFVSLLEFQEDYDQIVISTSPNKTFNIAGLSCSYVLSGNEKIRQDFQNLLNRYHFAPNRVGIEMTEIVYHDGQEWLQNMRQVVAKNVSIVTEVLESVGIQVMQPDAGFLVWVRLDSAINIEDFILKIAKDKNIYLETGSRFVDNYEGWLRINVGTITQRAEEAMRRFKDFYSSYLKEIKNKI